MLERPQRALVLGLGVGGESCRDLLEATGTTVVIADDERSPMTRLPPDIDVVVPRPGVPPGHHLLRQAVRRGVPIWSEIELAGRHWRGPAIAVTGTNGKGSVVTLVADAFNRGCRRARAVGNIGDPACRAVLEESAETVLVFECSSFHLYYLHTFAPDAAAVLNISPDHQDWHSSLAQYARAKERIFRNQTPGQWAVLHASVGRLGARSLASRCVYSEQCPPRRRELGVIGDVLVAGAGAPGGAGELMTLRGRLPHEVANALAVFGLVRALDPGFTGVAAEAIRAFAGLAHQRQVVAVVDGVSYVDDSKATNPAATVASLTVPGPIVLIAGGRSKGLDLRPVADSARGKVRALVAIGEAAPELLRLFAESGIEATATTSIDAAVQRAAEIARPGDTVLLAPACASFDMWSGMAARGDAFAAAVHALQGASRDGG